MAGIVEGKQGRKGNGGEARCGDIVREAAHHAPTACLMPGGDSEAWAARALLGKVWVEL